MNRKIEHMVKSHQRFQVATLHHGQRMNVYAAEAKRELLKQNIKERTEALQSFKTEMRRQTRSLMNEKAAYPSTWKKGTSLR
jgi:hypothetical protein